MKQLRCPVCLAREVDVVLRPLGDDRYACVKCSFTGDEAAVRLHYTQARQKYRWLGRRFTLDELRAL